MFHRHQWNPPKDRIQTCAKCGLARTVGCSHEFETIKEIQILEWEQQVGLEYVLRCKKCGDIRSRRILSPIYEAYTFHD